MVIVLAAMFVHTLLTNDNFQWGIVFGYFHSASILTGLRNTVVLTVIAMLLGLAFGVVLAVGLGRLAVPTTMLTRLSTDAFGDELLARLEESGVDTAMVQRGDEPTTLAVVTLDSDMQHPPELIPTLVARWRMWTFPRRCWRSARWRGSRGSWCVG